MGQGSHDRGPLVHDMVQARDMILARGTLQLVQGGKGQARGSLMVDDRGQGPAHNGLQG